jgi:hypothetical protein
MNSQSATSSSDDLAAIIVAMWLSIADCPNNFRATRFATIRASISLGRSNQCFRLCVGRLRFWSGRDLTVKADRALGKVYVRSAKWMGDSYDAIFDPGHPTRLWRNGRELAPLDPTRTWHACKYGNRVKFSPE